MHCSSSSSFFYCFILFSLFKITAGVVADIIHMLKLNTSRFFQAVVINISTINSTCQSSEKAKFHYVVSRSQTWSQTWFPTCRRQVRAISTCRDSLSLVADRLAAGFRPAFDRPATRTSRHAHECIGTWPTEQNRNRDIIDSNRKSYSIKR